MAGFFYGIISDNKDPTKLGRCKVDIIGVNDGLFTCWLPIAGKNDERRYPKLMIL